MHSGTDSIKHFTLVTYAPTQAFAMAFDVALAQSFTLVNLSSSFNSPVVRNTPSSRSVSPTVVANLHKKETKLITCTVWHTSMQSCTARLGSTGRAYDFSLVSPVTYSVLCLH